MRIAPLACRELRWRYAVPWHTRRTTEAELTGKVGATQNQSLDGKRGAYDFLGRIGGTIRHDTNFLSLERR
jgi:hypothetical protein